MTYYSGFVAAVPTANKQAYLAHVAAVWPIFRKLGALRAVECWGEDIQPGKQTDFFRATQAKDGETPIFSWIEWPDRETCDTAWAQMADEMPAEGMPEMPFDGSRMFWGGFSPLFTAGSDRGSYYQGFVTPVAPANKEAYAALAKQAWEDMFQPNGCLGSHELWDEDVPHGTRTDFYRAVDAAAGDAVVFSFTAWPDRATCDKAAEAMTTAMDGQPMPDMPFDGKKMIWGGFTPIFDSAKL